MGYITYGMLLFGITIALWLSGVAHSPLFELMGCPTGGSTCVANPNIADTIINALSSVFTNPALLIAIPGSIITGLILGGTFAMMFAIPFMIGMVLINIFLLPTQLVLGTSGMPWEISLIIGGFLNILLILTIVSFVRGGE